MVENVGNRERVIVNLPIRLLIDSLKLVESGRFKSIDHVVESALSSLLSKGDNTRGFVVNARKDNESASSRTTIPATILDENKIPMINISKERYSSFVEPILPSELTNALMPITIQKMLPIKFCVSELVLILQDRGGPSIRIEELITKISQKAKFWDQSLLAMDESSKRKRGEQLSTSFPNYGDVTGKSIDRFLDSNFGYILKDGRQSGALPYLGFASLSNADGELSIGITKEGLDFALLRNPVLNDGENVYPPFSPEERNFLLEHIVNRCPNEANHMSHYIKTVQDHLNASRLEINRCMRSFYERIWNPLELTNALVDSLRGGVNGRCGELNLTQTSWKGKNALYTVTEDGLRWLEVMQKKRR